MDAALLAGADADGLAVHRVAHGVGLGVFQGDQGDDQVPRGGIRQVLGLRHDIREQLPVDLKVVAALLEGDAEDLLGFLYFGHVVRVDLHDVVVALALGLQDLQGFGFIAASDTSRLSIFAVVTSHTSLMATQSPKEHIRSVPRARA